jgi:hypothetical protein
MALLVTATRFSERDKLKCCSARTCHTTRHRDASQRMSRVGDDSDVVQQQRSFMEIMVGRFAKVDAALGQVLLAE